MLKRVNYIIYNPQENEAQSTYKYIGKLLTKLVNENKRNWINICP